MHVKLLLKNGFVEKMRPAMLALFVYVSTNYVKTVKKLECNRYDLFTGCPNGNAPA